MKTCPVCKKVSDKLKATIAYWDKHYMFKAQNPEEIVNDFKVILKLLNKEIKNESINSRL